MSSSIGLPRLAAAAALLICGAGAAVAQGLPMSPELKAFLSRPDEQQQFGGMMTNIWQSTVENCPKPAPAGLNVLIETAPTFDAGGRPKSGEWRVVGQWQGCGKTRMLSILYIFGQDGQMRRIGLLPGSSATSLRLQSDALMYAAMGMAKLRAKDCQSNKVVDTKFIRFEGDAPPTAADIGKRGWIEEWTVRSCNVTGIVTMNFTPDATGTTITTALDKTRKADP